MPGLSVIMPSLNVVKYITTCLDSVLSQSYRDIEVLCIDAGSDDGTFEILREYENKDSRVKVVVSDRKSYGYQINLGIRLSTGQYVGVVETDDIVTSNMYEVLVNTMEIHRCDYVKGRPILYFDDEGKARTEKAVYVTDDLVERVVAPCEKPELLEEDIFLWDGVYRRDFIRDMHLNESNGAAFQDQGFLLQTISSAKRAYYLNQVVYYYRQDNVNSSIYNHNGFKYISDEYRSNRDILKSLSEEWHSAFYKRMFTQARSRFYSMVDSGSFWDDAAESMESVRQDLEYAVKVGYLYHDLLGKDLWERLHICIRSFKDAYEWEKCRMTKEKKEGEEIVRQLPTGLLRWFPFEDKKRILFIGKPDDAMAEMLAEKNASKLDIYEYSQIDAIDGEYDYIVAIRYVELCSEPIKVLSKLKQLLGDTGTMLLGFNNRLGIRNFAGDKDVYTDKVFDGINDYRYASDSRVGTTYDRASIEEMLRASGVDHYKTYAVVSDLENPAFILADGYKPNEDLANRIFPTYHYAKSVFLEEEKLYDSLLKNGMFYQMANAFLIECRNDDKFCDALQITSTLERGKENAMITVVHGNGFVTKQAAWGGEKEKVRKLAKNSEILRSRGIMTVDYEIKDDVFTMPFIKEKTGQIYLMDLMQTDKERFFSELDRFIETIKASSDSYDGEYKGIHTTILKNAMIDMMPLNCFMIDGEYVFFDQEYCLPEVPLNVMIGRVIANLFFGNQELQNIVSKDELHKRYGLITENDCSNLRTWLEGGWDFLIELRKEKELAEYNSKVRRNPNVLNQNRERMNLAAEDYQLRCIELFDDVNTKKVILFGSGIYAKKFFSLYGDDIDICFAVDNDPNKWNTKLYMEGREQTGKDKDGIDVLAPESISQFKHGEYKVIICAKKYEAIRNQLEAMGVYEYGIYNPQINYRRRRIPITSVGFDVISENKRKKKYHIGYNAGVFDLYHIGHLNMFKRAKELCDYLIVGVVSDEGVRKWKKTETFVPFEERKAMVESCRYVDEVVEIPMMYASTEYAWKLHHFDVQFSGSDYIDDPYWLGQKAFLEKHGATMEFFPYTESTSSTKLKALIEKKLV